MKKLIMGVCVFVLMCSPAYGATVSPGNLLVSSENRIYEYDTEGSLVQDFPIQYPGGAYPPTEYAREIAADINGKVHVYNGTFYPYMSTYDSVSSTWSHVTYDRFNTVNNTSYGGIDVYGDLVFTTDMFTYGGGEAQGVVVFNTSTGQAQRFATDTEPIDLTIGLNGLLYTLFPGGSPEGRYIRVYDPLSLIQVESISLSAIFGHTGHRSIAIDEQGDIFIADWDGQVHHITGAGELVKTTVFGGSFYDIDIAEDGRIALSDRSGRVVLTDRNLSGSVSFYVRNHWALSGPFVEFIPIAEPATLSVDIDIKPGSDQNSIKLGANGVIPVAILGSESFDVLDVDPSTVLLEGAAPRLKVKNDKAGSYEDVNGDGYQDLVVHILDFSIGGGSTEANLTGQTYDGTPISGSDSISIVLEI